MKKIITISIMCILLVGCGIKGIPVNGTVTLDDGMPLTKGQVALSTDTKTFTGTIGADGNFSMGQTEDGQGIPAGTYSLTISSSPAYGEQELIDVFSVEPKTVEVQAEKNPPLNIKVKRAEKK
jgi:hypothetical protein